MTAIPKVVFNKNKVCSVTLPDFKTVLPSCNKNSSIVLKQKQTLRQVEQIRGSCSQNLLIFY